ncbi:MAG: SAM-dependent methyltransferase, partial [Betaproteobacteria bacterium]
GPLARRLVLLAWQGSDAYLKAAVTEVEWNWLQQVRAVSLASLPTRVTANMPPWLLERMQAILGDECAAFVQAMEGSAPLDLRVNTFKAKREAVQAAFESLG